MPAGCRRNAKHPPKLGSLDCSPASRMSANTRAKTGTLACGRRLSHHSRKGLGERKRKRQCDRFEGLHLPAWIEDVIGVDESIDIAESRDNRIRDHTAGGLPQQRTWRWWTSIPPL